MRRIVFLVSLLCASAISAGTLTKRKAIYPPSGTASGELSVNLKATTLKHSYLTEAPGQTCTNTQERAQQVYIANREIDDFTLLSPVRLDKARAVGLSYVLVRLCPSSGQVLAVDVYHRALGKAGYVSLPPPFPFAIKRSGERISGEGAMPTPNLFLSNEYHFKASFKAELLKLEPL